MIKDFNVIIDKLAFFDLPIKTEEEAYEKIIDISSEYTNIYTEIMNTQQVIY